MKNLNIPALNKALFISSLLLYFVLAFGGLISGHYLPLWGHVGFAILGFVYVTVGIYCEETAEELPQEKTPQHLAQAKYGWGQ